MNPTNMSAKMVELVSQFGEWDNGAGVWHFNLPLQFPSYPVIKLDGADWFDLSLEFQRFIVEQGIKFHQISLPHDGTFAVLGLRFADPVNAPVYETLYQSNNFAVAA